jgi:hypothetical protein
MRSKIYAGVVAVAMAFLLATNPIVAEAVGHITSADIRNNGVKSIDIKNGDVKLIDLRGGAKQRLSTKSWEYTLPVRAAATDRTYSFPGLPAGTYLASIRVIADVPLPGDGILCVLDKPEDHGEYGLGYGATPELGYSTVATTSLIKVNSTVSMFCNTQDQPETTWTLMGGNDRSTVTFTKVDKVVASKATATKPAKSASRGDTTGR